MSLLSLPNEILRCICEYLVYSDDINSLSQSCCQLYSSVNPLLFPPCAKQSQLDAIKYALETEDHLLMERLAKAGIDVFDTYLNATPDELLPVAVEKGHLGIVRVLVNLDKDILHKEIGFNHLPLTSALLLGHLEIARFLVSQGANPDFLGSVQDTIRTEERPRRTALSYTAKHGPLESVQFLVEETRSDLEARGGWDGWTPLLYAVSYGPLEVLRYLIQAGANPNVRDNRGRTALFHAAQRQQDQEEVVLLLLENHENTLLEELDALTLAYIACKEKGRIADLLLKRIDLSEIASSAADDELSLLLFTSAACGSYSFAQLLLKEGCEPFDKVLLGNPGHPVYYEFDSPLWQAAANGHSSMVWLFLGSVQYNYQLGPFILNVIRATSRTNECQLLKSILDSEMAQQLNPTTLKSFISEALYFAVYHEEATQVLFNYGANMDTESDGGFDILQRAVLKGNHASVKLLLKATGFDPLQRVPDRKPPTLIQTAQRAFRDNEMVNYHEMTKTLLETNDNVDFHPENKLCELALVDAMFCGELETVEYFLDHGFDVNGPTGDPLLVQATSIIGSERSNSVVKFLLNRGAEVDITGRDQKTALWSAADMGDPEIVQVLLDHGANPLHKGKAGQNPLYASFSGSSDARVLRAILKSMEERGIQYDLTGLVHKAEKYLWPDIPGDKRLKYLEQHWCRMKNPCR